MCGDAAEQNVLQRRKAADQMVLLEDHSRSAAVFPQRPATPEDRTPAFDDDIALGRLDQSIHASKQRRLARPEGPSSTRNWPFGTETLVGITAATPFG